DTVVLVSVNSLRGDHLGIGGYPRPTSPFLDELASQGAYFERAYAASARGALSLATLLTGLEPREHGLRDAQGALDPRIPTLAEGLASEGLLPAAFVSTWSHFQPRALDRGFAHFDAPPERAEHPYRAADRTVAAALAWLEQQGAGERVFLFLELSDPSHPFRAPPGYLPMAIEGVTGEDYYAFLEESHGVPLGWYRWEHVMLNRVFNNYDAEVRFVDAELRRLQEGLTALGRGERTLFVVTAAHGTGLGNHFWDGAGQVLYEEQVRVPLIVAVGDGSLAPRRAPDVVSHKDVLPTIFALLAAEVPAPPEAPAPSGRSLLPLLQGDALEPRPAFFDRGVHVPLSKPQENLVERSPIPPRPGPLVGGVDARWKLLDYAGPDDELYDLENDPFERVNLLGDGVPAPAEVQALQQAVGNRLPGAGRQAADRDR
ncbi:MAG: sulfatase, partial [Myxococcota bacterium]